MSEWADPGSEQWKNHPWSRVFKERTTFASSFCVGGKVLDACCGSGWSTEKISEVAKSVIGIDVSSKAIQLATEKYSAENITYMVMNALAMNFENEIFDTVVSLEAIEHFDKTQVEQYLKEISKVLKKGGILVGSTPRAKTVLHKVWYIRQNKYHKVIYNKKTLTRLLGRYFSEVNVIEKHSDNYLLFHCKKL